MNRSIVRVVRAAMCCMLVALGVPRAAAGPGPITEPLTWTPADADAVFVLSDGSAARTTAIGLAGERALLGLLVGAEQTRDAWSAFARTLGYAEPEAFDALLGRRFAIIARGFWSADAPTEWAIVSDIMPEVDERIRDRIASPPREVIARMPVFALEQGRFSLLRHEGGTRIVIAPTTSMPLLKSIALGMGKGGEKTLAATDIAARLERLGDGDALGLVRFPDQIGGWWGAVAELDDHTAIARLVTALEQPMAPPDARSIEAWRTLGADAALLFVERMMEEDAARPQGLNGIFAEVSEALDPVLEAGEADTGALVMLPRDGGGLEVGGALACRDGGGAAAAVDSLMQRLAATLGAAAGDASAGHDFGGMFPESERRVRIGKAGGFAPVLGRLPIELVWRLLKPEGGDDAGWWVGGTSGSVHDRLAGTIASEAAGDRERWLSYGVARPNLLVERLGSTGLPIPTVVRGFTGIATVEWWSWMEGAGEMLGMVEITAMPDPEGF